MGWFLSFDFAPAFEDHSDETTDLDYVLYFGCRSLECFTFAGGGIRRLGGPDLHRRSPDAGGWGRTSRNPGCPMDDRRAGLAGGSAFPTSQGSKTSEAERLPEARRDVTYARDPPGSGASSPHLRALRFRSPFHVRLLREARLVRLGDMSVCGIT